MQPIRTYEGSPDHPDVLQNGLAVARAIHDRYSAELRNPYNEIDDGDHYVRAMASYGAYQAVCGYEHHGPQGYLAFAPRLNQRDLKAAFTAANCWGTFSQQIADGKMHAQLDIKFGVLELKQVKLRAATNWRAAGVMVEHNKESTGATFRQDGPSLYVDLDVRQSVHEGETLRILLY